MKMKLFVTNILYEFQWVTFLLASVSQIDDMTTLVEEHKVSSCNTQCTYVELTCPAGYSVAIREAIVTVNARRLNSAPCSMTQRCHKQVACCEHFASHDCVFRYASSHLEAVHRNCSGARTCQVKTERTREELVACPFYRPADTTSHSILNYLCINDYAILDLCSTKEKQTVGRTLFALLNSKQHLNLDEGGVCRCTAESTRWPTTNTIAVFLLDARFTVHHKQLCSDAELSLKAGSSSRLFNCETSRNFGETLPFVALLNHSNVAIAQLNLRKNLPDFIWIGFESNEAEDLQLTCGLQGYVPKKSTGYHISVAPVRQIHDNITTETKNTSKSAVLSGVVATISCIITAVILIILFAHRRNCGKEPHLADNESHRCNSVMSESSPGDYCTVPDIQGQTEHALYAQPVKQGGHRCNMRPSSGVWHHPDLERQGDPVYITAAVVRKNKHEAYKKQVPACPGEDVVCISGDRVVYYSPPWGTGQHEMIQKMYTETTGSDPRASAAVNKPDTNCPHVSKGNVTREGHYQHGGVRNSVEKLSLVTISNQYDTDGLSITARVSDDYEAVEGHKAA